MRRLSILIAVLFIAAAAAAQQPTAAELIEKAIDAHGGRDVLEAWPHLSQEGSLQTTGWRSDSRWPIVTQVRSDGAFRTEVTFEFRGRKVTPVQFWDGGDLHKRRFRSGWDDLPLDEPREEAAHRLPILLSAIERSAEVSGEGEEDGVAVWVVTIEDGRDKARLSLSKEDGTLLAMEYPGTSAEGMGTKEEVVRKLVFKDHREVADILMPFDIETFEDGTPKGHLRFDSMEVLDDFDDAWIRVPDPTRRFIPPEELVF